MCRSIHECILESSCNLFSCTSLSLTQMFTFKAQPPLTKLVLFIASAKYFVQNTQSGWPVHQDRHHSLTASKRISPLGPTFGPMVILLKQWLTLLMRFFCNFLPVMTFVTRVSSPVFKQINAKQLFTLFDLWEDRGGSERPPPSDRGRSCAAPFYPRLTPKLQDWHKQALTS